MVTHSSILAWEILWTEEPGGLQFLGVERELDMTLKLNNNHGPEIVVGTGENSPGSDK